jgi:hypothetical protein
VNWCKFFLLGFIVFLGISATAQTQQFENFTIHISQNQVTISKTGEIVLQDSFAVNNGTCLGFSFPEKQPFKEYFIFTKHEKQQGKTYILYKDGSLQTISGGAFWAGIKHSLLFILAERDYDNLIIYNLKNRKIEVNKFNCDEFIDWYYYKGKYFGKVGTECGEEEKKEREMSEWMRPVEVEEFVVSFGTLTEAHKTEREVEKANKLQKYCSCK